MVYPHLYRAEHSETHTTNAVYGEYYAQHQSKKIHIQPNLLKILQYIDSNRGKFENDLADIVKIQSVAGSLKHQGDLKKMIDVTEEWLTKLGVKYERFNIGFYEMEGKKVRLPTVILGNLGRSSKKKTICIYGHLDVKDPDMTKWTTNPWEMNLIGRHFYGNGVASSKSVLLAWFHVIEAFQAAKLEIPVNLKFIIEGMGHHQSQGLAEFMADRKQDLLYDIDNVVVCDSEWLGEKHPCIIYGTIGILHYDVFVEKTDNSTVDPKEEIEQIFREVVGDEDQILIPRFYDIVDQITPEEEKRYEAIKDFDIEEARKFVPPFRQSWDQVRLLMAYWRLPSMYVDDVEECTCDKKQPVIVKQHFIVKIVPKQIIERSTKLTVEHINNIAKKLNTGNKVRCELVSSVRYWYENVNNFYIEAARRATIQIYKEDPNMIREDRAKYVITILDRILEKPILCLPLATKGSNVGADNENMSKKNFLESVKLLAAYLYQISEATYN